MSDGEYITDGPLIDLVTSDWREDILPFEHILVHTSCLPETEPPLAEKQNPLDCVSQDCVAESRWSELDLDNLLAGANPHVPPYQPSGVQQHPNSFS